MWHRCDDVLRMYCTILAALAAKTAAAPETPLKNALNQTCGIFPRMSLPRSSTSLAYFAILVVFSKHLIHP